MKLKIIMKKNKNAMKIITKIVIQFIMVKKDYVIAVMVTITKDMQG